MKNIKITRKITQGMYVLTTQNGGCIVDAVSQISSGDNPLIAVSVMKSNYTNELIKKSGKVNISVLSNEADMLLIGKYGFRTGRDFNKFDSTETIVGENGVPCVKKHTVSYFETKVINEVDAGTHTIFLLEVENAVRLNDKTPMTYDYYHRVVKGKTPKNAATFSN